jgi:TRAP-type C4-dicarboxylate transport system permease small subunit
MENLKKEDRFIKDMMRHSAFKMPFEDFEDRMMDKIYEEKQQKTSVQKSTRIAWVFFFLGLFFGLLITSLTSTMDYQLIGIPLKKLAYLLQIGIALVLLFQLDWLLNLTLRKKD